MLNTILKGLVVMVLVVSLVYAGTCVYGNLVAQPSTGMPKLPDREDASWSLHIKNTGGVVMTDDLEQVGDEVGTRVFIINGYWELDGKDFKYKDGMLVLREDVFGEITIRRR